MAGASRWAPATTIHSGYSPPLSPAGNTIAQLDEYAAAQVVPANIRPQVHKPILGRKALTELRAMLEGVLLALEHAWERRNQP